MSTFIKNVKKKIKKLPTLHTGTVQHAADKLQAASSSKAHHQLLELCIFTRVVGLYPPAQKITSDEDAISAMTTAPPNIPSSSGSDPEIIHLLSGCLEDFLLYSGQDSHWLLDIGHDICDPHLKRGTLRVWDGSQAIWASTNLSDPLTASLYRYDIENIISLSKISVHRRRSITTSSGDAGEMANQVKGRDGNQCWVSSESSEMQLINSHICPKRMGDHLLRTIYHDFVSPLAIPISVYNAICGITLSRFMDAYFNMYELGLRHAPQPEDPERYTCHFFRAAKQGRQCMVYANGYASIVTLHGYVIHPPHPNHPHNPPPGLFRWHYLQCVIQRFAHAEYKNLQNIHYYELPLRMEGDSDDEGTDSDFQWPSAALDRGRAMQMEFEEHEEHQRGVAEWVAGL